MTSARVEQAQEQLSEHSALTDALADSEAMAVLAWAEQRIIEADAAGDDNEFASRVAAIQAAVRAAARSVNNALPITERAEQAMRERSPHVGRQLIKPMAVPHSKHEAIAVSERPRGEATGLLAAPFRRFNRQRPRRKARRWTHRKAL